MPKQNRCHKFDSDHEFIFLVPNRKNGFGPFSFKFFVPIRVGPTVVVLKLESTLYFFLFFVEESSKRAAKTIDRLTLPKVCWRLHRWCVCEHNA